MYITKNKEYYDKIRKFIKNIKTTNITSEVFSSQTNGTPILDCMCIIEDSREIIETNEGLIEDFENDGEVLMAKSVKLDLSVIKHNLETFKGAYKILMN